MRFGSRTATRVADSYRGKDGWIDAVAIVLAAADDNLGFGRRRREALGLDNRNGDA